jgi:DnaK suppressor protein
VTKEAPVTTTAAARLAAERARTLERITALTRDFDRIVDEAAIGSTDDEHDPEGATLAFERAQVQALLDQAARRLSALKAAEERLRTGRYGLCAACGAPIDHARLEARPTAERCIACS